VYTREELQAWEEQQQRRKADGASVKGKGKGKETSASGGTGTGKEQSGQTTDERMETDEPPVQKVGELSTDASARGDQILSELLSGANQ
jgi:hypothetical protein